MNTSFTIGWTSGVNPNELDQILSRAESESNGFQGKEQL